MANDENRFHNFNIDLNAGGNSQPHPGGMGNSQPHPRGTGYDMHTFFGATDLNATQYPQYPQYQGVAHASENSGQGGNTSFQPGWDPLNQHVAFQSGFSSASSGRQLQAGDHGFFSENPPAWGPIRSVPSSHSHSAQSQSASKPRGPYNTKRRAELERFFTETVRDFAKPLFTAAIWKAGLFFIEADWTNNSTSDNETLDLCLQECYGTAVDRFTAEHGNKDNINIAMKLQNSHSPKALKEELLPSLSESLQSTLNIIRTIVDAHFAFKAPGMLEEEIRGKVQFQLKGEVLDLPLFEKIVVHLFFTPNNPWAKSLVYTFESGISVEIFALLVTMVRICLRDWAHGSFDSATPLLPKHKHVYMLMLSNLQEPGQATPKLLRKLWQKGMRSLGTEDEDLDFRYVIREYDSEPSAGV